MAWSRSSVIKTKAFPLAAGFDENVEVVEHLLLVDLGFVEVGSVTCSIWLDGLVDDGFVLISFWFQYLIVGLCN